MTHPLTSHATGAERIAELWEQLHEARGKRDDYTALCWNLESELDELNYQVDRQTRRN